VLYFGDRQANEQTDEQMDSPVAWSCSRCRERRLNKKVNYRKQIARQLRTQYVESIYSNSVTLKSRLEVTQGHWNWYHSKASVRFSIRFLCCYLASFIGQISRIYPTYI